jgi:hypothetical protein
LVRRPDTRYEVGQVPRAYHRLLDGHAYLSLGSTAHKQGRVAGINALGGNATFATAISYGADIDLSYPPPLGSPWDAVQIATDTWRRTVDASA